MSTNDITIYVSGIHVSKSRASFTHHPSALRIRAQNARFILAIVICSYSFPWDIWHRHAQGAKAGLSEISTRNFIRLLLDECLSPLVAPIQGGSHAFLPTSSFLAQISITPSQPFSDNLLPVIPHRKSGKRGNSRPPSPKYRSTLVKMKVGALLLDILSGEDIQANCRMGDLVILV